ncbi:hypothetical protein ONZ51_g11223 [Trametes cubensis]|uniref:DUF6818 domain-containing protein n=1 Tax=Trametes cubensis TaxID=1111947 RepID=A0AAD7TI19_9APHY|nr:hypothetical protein ONZ51_g11223 [Trametes cubensis]
MDSTGDNEDYGDPGGLSQYWAHQASQYAYGSQSGSPASGHPNGMRSYPGQSSSRPSQHPAAGLPQPTHSPAGGIPSYPYGQYDPRFPMPVPPPPNPPPAPTAPAIPSAPAQAPIKKSSSRHIFSPEPSSDDSDMEIRNALPFVSSQDSEGTKPAPKQDKGKRRAVDPEPSPSDSASRSVPKKAKVVTKPDAAITSKSSHASKPNTGSDASRAGRQSGSVNYTKPEIKELLKIIHEVLPAGQDGWKKVTETYKKWALAHGRPERPEKSLRNKFDALLREASKKPTGSAEIPEHLQEVLDIEQEIEAKDPEDDEDDVAAADEAEDSASDDVEIIDSPPPATQARSKSKGGSPSSVANSTSGPRRRQGQAQQLLSSISVALDPKARESRYEARYARRLLEAQVARLTQENDSLRTRNDALVERIQTLNFQLQQQTSEITRLQARLDIYDMMSSVTGRPGFPLPTTRGASMPPFSWNPGMPPENSPAPPASSSPSVSVQHRPCTPNNPALETLASVAASSRHTLDSDFGSSEVTVTFTPTRRRTQSLDGHGPSHNS